MNDIICKIYDSGTGRIYDGIILNNKIYFLDDEGEPLEIDESNNELTEYSVGIFFIDEDNFSEVGEDEGKYKWGYFHGGNGNIIIDPIYDRVYPFEDKIACVKLDGKYGFIDITGNEIIEPKYDYTDKYFSGELCPAKLNNKIGYIDKKGREKIKFKFDFGSEFLVSEIVDGIKKIYSVVKLNDKYGIIDENGTYLVEPIYEELKQVFFEDLLVAKFKGKYGLIKIIYNKEYRKLNIKYICDHIFDEFGSLIISRLIEEEQYFYSMKIGDNICIINKNFELFFSKKGKKYVDYKNTKIVVENSYFTGDENFRYRKFRTEEK